MNVIKEKNNRVLKSHLNIWWWNFGTKTIDFKGSAEEYLKEQNIALKIKYFNDKELNFERCKISVSFNIGGMQDVKFTCYDLGDAIRMCVNIRLTWLGDKSKFEFLDITRTINF